MKTKPLTILAALAVAGLLLAACGGGPQAIDVTLKGQDIKFDVTSLTATAGQTINLTLDNEGALEHSLVIDELGADTGFVAAGESTTISFGAGAAGTYEYYCNVPGHREAGMVGTLTVNP